MRSELKNPMMNIWLGQFVMSSRVFLQVPINVYIDSFLVKIIISSQFHLFMDFNLNNDEKRCFKSAFTKLKTKLKPNLNEVKNKMAVCRFIQKKSERTLFSSARRHGFGQAKD